MPSLNFFRNIHVEEPSFFDEGPKITKKSSNIYRSGSIQTIEIDGYRQGVELTQQKHFDAGTFKIHAGEPGHVLRRNRYGMDKNFRNDPRFQDMDYFDPVAYVRAQDVNSTLYYDVITFPIITGDNDQIENYVFDGVIEPLTIRPKIAFFSIEIPFESHDIKGSLMGGNSDQSFASDVITTIYSNSDNKQLAFLDQYVDTLPLPGLDNSTAHVSSIVAYYEFEKSKIKPFKDIRYLRNTISEIDYDINMKIAMSPMTGSTDNYLSVAKNDRSAICGWEYLNNITYGTDSIAFGGMTY